MAAEEKKEPPGADWRWLILALAALVIAGAVPLGRFLAMAWEGRAGPGAAKLESWRDLAWSWREDGAEGPGFYLEGGLARKSLPDEPRLAVFTSQPLDLNRAGVEVLQTVKGIGPQLARAIVAHREDNGPFGSVDDLLLLKGIGPGKLAALRAQLMVAAAPTTER